MTALYGIPNCDTMKKTRAWLAGHAVAYQFHDYKKSPPSQALLQAWIAQVGWEVLLNKRGTTWRKLPQELKDNVDEVRAIELMLANPSLIKRPVLDIAGNIHVGFDAQKYAEIFAA